MERLAGLARQGDQDRPQERLLQSHSHPSSYQPSKQLTQVGVTFTHPSPTAPLPGVSVPRGLSWGHPLQMSSARAAGRGSGTGRDTPGGKPDLGSLRRFCKGPRANVPFRP